MDSTVGGFSPYISDKQWVAAGKRVMKQNSPEQFLVNLLFVLRKTFGDGEK